jgi:hypothetical protein
MHQEQDEEDVFNGPAIPPMSDLAKAHSYAFAQFHLWASPLFTLGHVKVRNQAIAFDVSVSRRFMIANEAGKPIIEAQLPEYRWLELLPFEFAGLDRNHNALLLFTKPVAPLREFVIAIPFDVPEKLALFSGRKYLKIHLVEGTPTSGFTRPEGKYFVLEIRDIVTKKGAPKNKP